MNDGDLAARLTHPSHGIAARVRSHGSRHPDAHDVDRLRRGMTIDGPARAGAEVTLLR